VSSPSFTYRKGSGPFAASGHPSSSRLHPKLLTRLVGVAPHGTAQPGVRFERGGVADYQFLLLGLVSIARDSFLSGPMKEGRALALTSLAAACGLAFALAIAQTQSFGYWVYDNLTSIANRGGFRRVSMKSTSGQTFLYTIAEDNLSRYFAKSRSTPKERCHFGYGQLSFCTRSHGRERPVAMEEQRCSHILFFLIDSAAVLRGRRSPPSCSC